MSHESHSNWLKASNSSKQFFSRNSAPMNCAICRRRIERSGESYSVGRHKYHWRCFMKRDTETILPATALSETAHASEAAVPSAGGGEARESDEQATPDEVLRVDSRGANAGGKTPATIYEETARPNEANKGKALRKAAIS